jgi:hypothetical protein
LLGKHSTNWTTPPHLPVLFAVDYFSDRVLLFSLGCPGTMILYLCLWRSWDNRYVPLCPSWDGFSVTFYFWLASNHNPHDLHLPNNWDHRHVPPYPALIAHSWLALRHCLHSGNTHTPT